MSTYTHSHGTFKGKSDIEISYQSWVADKPRALVILVHGMGEHSGRYQNLIDAMSSRKISFFAMDNRGHGKSTGTRGHVDSFMEYVYDLRMFTNMIRDQNPGLPVFLFGHSLGGAIALRYALTYQNDLNGLILSAPVMQAIVKPPYILDLVSDILSHTFSSVMFYNRLDPQYMSHDQTVVNEYINDPLVHDRITPRLYTEMHRNAEFCMNHAFELTLPLLVFHGTADRFVDIAGSERLVQEASSDDKRFIAFQSLYHETLNEIPKERAKVLSAVATWLISHILSSSPSLPTKKSRAIPKKKKAAPAKRAAKKTVSAKKKK